MHNNEDLQQITKIINQYFVGTYQGDEHLLRNVFHSKARITGHLNGQIFDWSLSDFISKVTIKPTSQDKQEIYDKKILFIDHTNKAAMVKAQVVVNGLTFTDYLSLLKINNEWVIRNKSFTT